MLFRKKKEEVLPKKEWFKTDVIGLSFSRNCKIIITKKAGSQICVCVDNKEAHWSYKNDVDRDVGWDKLQDELIAFYDI